MCKRGNWTERGFAGETQNGPMRLLPSLEVNSKKKSSARPTTSYSNGLPRQVLLKKEWGANDVGKKCSKIRDPSLKQPRPDCDDKAFIRCLTCAKGKMEREGKTKGGVGRTLTGRTLHLKAHQGVRIRESPLPTGGLKKPLKRHQEKSRRKKGKRSKPGEKILNGRIEGRRRRSRNGKAGGSRKPQNRRTGIGE